MADILVVTSKIKSLVQEEHELRTAGDVTAGLSLVLLFVLEKAAGSAKEAGRATMKARDVLDAWDVLTDGVGKPLDKDEGEEDESESEEK